MYYNNNKKSDYWGNEQIMKDILMKHIVMFYILTWIQQFVNLTGHPMHGYDTLTNMLCSCIKLYMYRCILFSS